MYSNIQKQCLQQLGVVAYDLKPTEVEDSAGGTPDTEPSQSERTAQAMPKEHTTANSQSASRPPLSSLLKTSTSDYNWQTVPALLKQDLVIMFGDINFEGSLATFNNGFSWQVELLNQNVGIESNRIVTGDPAKLSHADKKAIWQWWCTQGETVENQNRNA